MMNNDIQQIKDTLKCSICQKDNRSVAKYCRFCGNEIEDKTTNFQESQVEQVQNSMKEEENSDFDFIGLDEIKNKISQFIAWRKIENEQKKQGLNIGNSTTLIIFRGDTGTGKSLVAESFIKQLQENDCLESNRIERITAKSLKRSFEDEFAISQHLVDSKAGILLIDEIQTDESYLHEILLGLTKKSSETICILLGTKDPLDDYFENYPEDIQRVSDFFEFPSISNENLCKILERKISEMGFEFDESVKSGFMNCIQEAKTDSSCIYKNGWIVEKEIIKEIKTKQASRLRQSFSTIKKEDYRRILLEDLPITMKKLSTDEVLSQLDELIGMENVKQAIRELCQTIQMNKKREEVGIEVKNPAIHIVFTGNPGTGKTTVARLLGKLFYAMQLLPSDKVVETDKSKLVAQYVGQTPKLVNKVIDNAMGGVLFIDEAYTLAGDGINKDTYGQEAIDTLMKRMEDDRGKFVVIAAGYENEMQNFLSANSGLKSRFTHFIHLEDYNPDELFELYCLYAKKACYVLSPEAKNKAYLRIEEIYKNRGKDFANGRTIRNLFDETIRQMSTRIATVEDLTKEMLVTILEDDIPHNEVKKLSVQEILSDLDELIGMENVKQAIRELCQTIQMNKKREEVGIEVKNPAIHIVFTGNPGTGKTTVARLLGKLFYAMQLLPSDKVVETDKSKLVAQYVGQTPKLVNKVIDNAMGGVLFIDEAYTLAGDGINKDTYGQEAIDTLMKRMEDDRGKFVVIAAGYENEMQNFLSANSGLKSRFTHFIHLEDYNPDELFELYCLYAKKSNYIIHQSSIAKLKEAIQNIYDNRGSDFANGRTIRNFFDETTRKLNTRIAKLPESEQTKEVLLTITEQDI